MESRTDILYLIVLNLKKCFSRENSALSEQETERNICILYYDQISSPMRDGLIYI